jgi:hypothetical protein
MLPRPSPRDQAQAKARLEAMGIPTDLPREAVDQAWRASSRCTEHDVLSMEGFLSWGVPIRFLRDKLCPLGWSMDRKNLETVISPNGLVAIASARGNSHTGDPDRMPSTLTEKGPQTQLVVLNNQLSFDELHARRLRESEQPAIETWFLLHYYDAKDKEVRIELSRGMKFASYGSRRDHGVVSHFDPRILLDPIDVASGINEEQGQETAADDQIDISVTRRQVS